MAIQELKNSECFEKWLLADQNKKISTVCQYLMDYYDLSDCIEAIKSSVMDTAKYFCMRASTYWRISGRSRNKFNDRYTTWLNNYINLKDDVKAYLNEKISNTSTQEQSLKKRGRPQKPFDDINLASKKRRVIDLVQTRDPEELSFAASWSGSPDKQTKNKLMPLEALALMIDLDLSYRKYNRLRDVINELHPDTLPSYHCLMKVKNDLIPESINATETQADVNLQQLLNKTAQSVIKIAERNQVTFMPSIPLKLVCKWGFDGSSGHSTYKQRFSDAHSTDEYLFLTALVPLQLVEIATENVKWENDSPSSTFYCRPLRVFYSKETSKLVREEETRVNNLINNLESACIKLSNSTDALQVSYEMLFTMIDGSICNIVTGTNSTQTCYVCGATPKLMNAPNVNNREPKKDVYRYGLSTLHNWIRSFECLLHISYRLPLKCWQVRGKDNKIVFEENKKRIQNEFKDKLGILVDKPKPGYGSTNDGNTARSFFKNAELTAEITGLDINLIKKFSIINRVLSSGCKINITKFVELTEETKTIYLSEYSWYYMPVSIHKVLIHGADIISSFPLPIGQLSEDALEGRHKDARFLRLHHTRKNSRINNNHDLLTMMLLSSDPLISSLRPAFKKRRNATDAEIMEYLD